MFLGCWSILGLGDQYKSDIEQVKLRNRHLTTVTSLSRWSPIEMHSALLIDEILRNIFYLCLDHNRHNLVSASRSCKSWKDPALDLVWDRLTSFEPLLRLLPGVLVIDGEYVCLNFCPIDKVNLIYSVSFPHNIPWGLGCIQVVRATCQTCQLPTRIQTSSHHI